MRLNHRITECLQSPIPYHHITKCVFVVFLFLLNTSCSTIQKKKKAKNSTKKAKNSLKRETESKRQRVSIRTRLRYSRMLELSDWKFKTTVIKMLRTLIDKVDSMQEQTGYISREEEILRKKKEMIEIKNSVN